MPKSDPEYYKSDSYWTDVNQAILCCELEGNELAQNVVREAVRRGIAVKPQRDKSPVSEQLDTFLQQLKSAA